MKHRFLTLTLLVLLTACGRDDAPVQAAKPGSGAASPDAVSVATVLVTQQTIEPWLYAQGTVRAVRREFLSFPSPGRIAYVDPRLKEGDRVKKGQLIAYQQPDRGAAERATAQAGLAAARTDLAVARAAQAEAAANLTLAQHTFERFRILLEKRSASVQEFEEAEARLAGARAAKEKADARIGALQAQIGGAGAQLEQAKVTVAESRIVAPIDGVLARLNIEQGYYFSPQLVQTSSEQAALSTIPVFIIDPSAYEVSVDLPAYEIDRLAVGARALMSPESYVEVAPGRSGTGASAPPGAAIEARVYAITPSIDPEKRTFQVKVRTTRNEGRLKDGQFISLWIAGQASGKPLPAVPLDALRYDDGQAFAFVLDQNRRTVSRRALRLGPRGRDLQGVVEGIKAGETVVTSGRASLADGDQVRILPDRSPGEGK